MKCDQYLQLLDPYMDDELNVGERDAFEHHAKVCGTCHARLEDRRKLLNILTSARNEEWSIDIADSIMTAIQTMPATGSSSPLRLPIIIAVASTLIVFLLLMLFGAGSIVTGIPPLDILKTLVSMVEMPSTVQSNLHELRIIFGTLLGVGKSMILLIWSFFRSSVMSSPLLAIPAAGLLAGIAFILWFRVRFSRGTS